MVRMPRRTITLCLAATVLAGTLAACSTDDGAGAAPAVSRTPAALTDVSPAPSPSSSPAPSGLVPRTPAPVTPAAGKAPAQAFAVGVRELSLQRGADRPLRTTVWYPATGAPGSDPAEGRTAARGPFPLVLFSHGLTAAPTDYAATLARWAQAGFVVAGPAYPRTSTGVTDFDPVDVLNQPADGTKVITDVLALNTKAGDPLQGRIDPERIGAAGHSGGGITTVGMLSTNRDDRLDAAIVLAGRQLLVAPFTGSPVPVLFVHGKRDSTVPYADGLVTYKSVPWSRAMLTVTEGGHVTTGRDFETVAATTTEFLRWSLYGDATAKARIASTATERDVATFTDEL